ncbi:MAG TPA: sulfotransferase [Candidatus Obscuribacterales bacterium]
MHQQHGYERPLESSQARNPQLDQLLAKLNGALALAEASLDPPPPNPWPVLFLIGNHRSGTTLFIQWLAAQGHWSYPSNLISRFHRAPRIGAQLQRLLTDPTLQVQDEFAELSGLLPEIGPSRLGKTRGLLSPHAFLSFWRQHLPLKDRDQVDRSALDTLDPSPLAGGLAGLAGALGKPLAMKAMILNCHIDWLARAVPESFFVWLRRDPFFVAQSVLEARRRLYGTIEAWFAFRLEEHEELMRLTPYEQVAGQIHYTDAAILRAMAKLEPGRVIEVDYEAFCGQPAAVYARLRAPYAQSGLSLPTDYAGPAAFASSQRLPDPEESALLLAALERFGLKTSVG